MATGDGDGRGPYQQDPFTHIVAIHFPSDFTKLDFVNNRYMVRNKDQSLGDVIQAGQVSYRTSDGLDLRGQVDGAPDPLVFPRIAYLRNKTATPDKANPGALNEALFLKSTFVLEFDYYDYEALIAALPGYDGQGFDRWFEILKSAKSTDLDQEFSVITTESETTIAAIPPHDVVTHYPYVIGPLPIMTEEEWYDGGSDAEAVNDMFKDSEGNQILIPLTVLRSDGTIFVYGPSFVDAGIAPPGTAYHIWTAPDPVTGGSYADASSPDAVTVGGVVGLMSVGQPGDYIKTFHDPGRDAETYSKWVPALGAWDRHYSAGWNYGRTVGAAPNVSDTPISDNELPAPAGRVRIAITVTASGMIASINGSNPVFSSGGAPSFAIPRKPPMVGLSRPAYFPNTDGGSPTDNYKVTMNAPIIMRCIWLFRRPRKVSELKAMSTIAPLPGAASPKWTKPPGQDQ
jgi:hypothetical protein